MAVEWKGIAAQKASDDFDVSYRHFPELPTQRGRRTLSDAYDRLDDVNPTSSVTTEGSTTDRAGSSCSEPAVTRLKKFGCAHLAKRHPADPCHLRPPPSTRKSRAANAAREQTTWVGLNYGRFPISR